MESILSNEEIKKLSEKVKIVNEYTISNINYTNHKHFIKQINELYEIDESLASFSYLDKYGVEYNAPLYLFNHLIENGDKFNLIFARYFLPIIDKKDPNISFNLEYSKLNKYLVIEETSIDSRTNISKRLNKLEELLKRG